MFIVASTGAAAAVGTQAAHKPAPSRGYPHAGQIVMRCPSKGILLAIAGVLSPTEKLVPASTAVHSTVSLVVDSETTGRLARPRNREIPALPRRQRRSEPWRRWRRRCWSLAFKDVVRDVALPVVDVPVGVADVVVPDDRVHTKVAGLYRGIPGHQRHGPDGLFSGQPGQEPSGAGPPGKAWATPAPTPRVASPKHPDVATVAANPANRFMRVPFVRRHVVSVLNGFTTHRGAGQQTDPKSHAPTYLFANTRNSGGAAIT
jgi:hypothetical protein